MILDTGTLVAILIALLSSVTIMFIATARITKLEKEIRRLQIELRRQRTK